MEMIIDNWMVIVGILAFIIALVSTIVKFLRKPKVDKLSRIRSVLVQLVTEAEHELGQGTGELKLITVYTKFIEKFPLISLFITQERFKQLVDESLAYMKETLAQNEEIAEYLGENSDHNEGLVLEDTAKEFEVFFEESHSLECAACGIEVSELDVYNGELMCEECYVEFKESEV